MEVWFGMLTIKYQPIADARNIFFFIPYEGRRQKDCSFWWWGPLGGGRVFGARPQLSVQKLPLCFCFHSMQNPSKRVKTQ